MVRADLDIERATTGDYAFIRKFVRCMFIFGLLLSRRVLNEHTHV